MNHKLLGPIAICLGLVLSVAACQATPTETITDVGPESCQNRVLVEVWSDLDGDGEIDPGEPPVEDALIILTRQANPDEDNIQTRTNADGQALFGGFEMNDCSSEGYQILFARSVPGFLFPEDPLFTLDGYDMIRDVVYFGLIASETQAE